MTTVEIEEALSELVAAPFDPGEFSLQFLVAFGAKDVTVAKLRNGSTNLSDIPGGLLQRNNIHLAVANEGAVSTTLAALRASPKTKAGKVKFILATDGVTLEAENLNSGEPLICDYVRTGDHFGFFLALAGISSVKEVINSAIDIKATLRLNKLYVELLKDNPEWASIDNRPALNRFIARLIFCFFAEDTGIFFAHQQFTATVEQMSDGQSKTTHEIIECLFKTMATRPEDRAALNLRPWATTFPYVNGDLFSGDCTCPRFSKLARSYFLSAGHLDWKDIYPDIFGSMIQAVADQGVDEEEDEGERRSLGMHYTSVPNILKVLDPLFLDDLRDRLETAGTNVRKLRALRRRIATIRVFDPACGSGNFLVISYLQMREIEFAIAQRLGDDLQSWMKLENFYGIEIKGFAAEIARLALLIAEFQADCKYLDRQQACKAVLPLHKTGHIHVTNALRTDWLAICPPAKSLIEDLDLAGPTGHFNVSDEGSEDVVEPVTYICGNPPYRGAKSLTALQQADLKSAWRDCPYSRNTTDYVTGWFTQANHYLEQVTNATAAFVTTNSIVQGQQAAEVWEPIFNSGTAIAFAHHSFKWGNLAANNAGVTVVVIGMARKPLTVPCRVYDNNLVRVVKEIGCYLIPDNMAIIRQRIEPISDLPTMVRGNEPRDGGHLILDSADRAHLQERFPHLIARYIGSQELISGVPRHCLWIPEIEAPAARNDQIILERLNRVQSMRLAGSGSNLANQPHRFARGPGVATSHTIALSEVSSESREYLPADLFGLGTVISNKLFGIFDGPLWAFSLIVSRMHLIWTATVCGRLEMRYSYSSTLGWNNFPIPLLTENAKNSLTKCAEDVLLAREARYPASIDDLYKPETMPQGLKMAHDANDELLERIYVGRRFRNDTERLEHLFALYEKMTAQPSYADKKLVRSK